MKVNGSLVFKFVIQILPGLIIGTILGGMISDKLDNMYEIQLSFFIAVILNILISMFLYKFCFQTNAEQIKIRGSDDIFVQPLIVANEEWFKSLIMSGLTNVVLVIVVVSSLFN